MKGFLLALVGMVCFLAHCSAPRGQDGSSRAAHSTALGVTVSEQVTLETPEILPASVRGTRVAYANGRFLAVWAASGRVLAARVDTNGTVLDAVPIGIEASAGSNADDPPAVASNGNDFLVVWRGTSYTPHLKAVRVRGCDGALRDPVTISPGGAQAGEAQPEIAYDGRQHFVTWFEFGKIRGAILRDGSVVPAGGRELATPSGYLGTLAVAAGTSNFLVAWRGHALRVSPTDATPLDPSPIPYAGISAGNGNPDVAFDGANYYHAWTDPHGYLYGARIRASDGVLLDPDDPVGGTSGSIPLAHEGGHLDPRLIFDGRWLLVTSQVASAPFTFRVEPSTGQRSDDPAHPLSYPPAGRVSDIIVGEGHGLVVNGGLAGAFNDENGIFSTVAEEHPVAHEATWMRGPVAGSNGTDYLVVWIAPHPQGAALYGSRIRGSDHAILQPEGFFIGSGQGYLQSPAIASDGTDYLVTYKASNEVMSVRVRSADGSVEPAQNLGTSDGAPVVACDGTNYLVVGTAKACNRATCWSNHWGRRISVASGQIIDPTRITVGYDTYPWSQHPTYSTSPSVAVDQGSAAKMFLVCWLIADKVRIARLDGASGTALDGAGKTVSRLKYGVYTDYGTRIAPVASSGTDFVVSWSDNRSEPPPSPTFVDLYATRVRASDGVPLDGVESDFAGLRVATQPQWGLAFEGQFLAFDGRSFVMGWKGYPGLRAVRLTPTLSRLDPLEGFAITGPFPYNNWFDGFFSRHVGFASRGNGESIIAYGWYDAQAPALGNRAKARFVTNDASDMQNPLR